MAYRRTENVVRRLAARHDAILAAAASLAAETGINAVQIAPVAERAGIAAGTVYRYFPSKTDLVAALVAAVSEREIGAMRRAADAAPGPLSALAAAVTTFAARALANRGSPLRCSPSRSMPTPTPRGSTIGGRSRRADAASRGGDRRALASRAGRRGHGARAARRHHGRAGRPAGGARRRRSEDARRGADPDAVRAARCRRGRRACARAGGADAIAGSRADGVTGFPQPACAQPLDD